MHETQRADSWQGPKLSEHLCTVLCPSLELAQIMEYESGICSETRFVQGHCVLSTSSKVIGRQNTSKQEKKVLMKQECVLESLAKCTMPVQ